GEPEGVEHDLVAIEPAGEMVDPGAVGQRDPAEPPKVEGEAGLGTPEERRLKRDPRHRILPAPPVYHPDVEPSSQPTGLPAGAGHWSRLVSRPAADRPVRDGPRAGGEAGAGTRRRAAPAPRARPLVAVERPRLSWGAPAAAPARDHDGAPALHRPAAG